MTFCYLEFTSKLNDNNPPCIHIIACKRMTSTWDDIHGIKPIDVEESKAEDHDFQSTNAKTRVR